MNKNYAQAREKMIKNQLIARGIRDPGVLEAMGKIHRERFIDASLRAQAYSDRPLPIGHSQTISQPYIVALMTEGLQLTGVEKTLELGTGSGYQAAILAELSARVFTIERIKPLQDRAQKILKVLGYTNISFKVFNGTLGWEEHAPYDAIIVTAGAPAIPESLLKQLAEKGRLLIPVGDKYSQELIRLIKKDGNLIRRSLGGCRFVSLIGEQGWQEA
jgi:protein-L-isoaspartate(D-aspartate) O-methyltransferase